LQAVKVIGWGRVDYTNAGYTKDHAWNAVQINGQWQLLDATWGAGYADDSRHYVRSFDDFWFLTPPSQFVYTHYPDDASWQLLKPTVPVAEVALYPVLKTSYFNYGLNFGVYNQGLYSVTNGAGTICIQAPDDVLVMADLYQNNTKLSDSLVLCQRQGNTYQVNGRFPRAGDYELRIYAKWKTESGLYHQAIAYKLTSNQNILNQAGFPIIYTYFYTQGAYLYSPLTGNLKAGTAQYFNISVPGAKKMALVLNADSASRVIQPLSKQGQVFQGTFNIIEGKIELVAYFSSNNTYSWLVEYKGVTN
jgi:transglutaminase/protease-like cytokinesis protein 3